MENKNFRNMPTLRTDNGEQQIKRYVHSALTIDHNGIQAAIKENGKIVLTKVAKVQGEEVEFDEIEIPASLIFKLASLLKATRKVEYLSISAVATDSE